MTGFGAAASEEVGGFAIRVEVRSVNHRHLLVKTRVPGELLFLENEIEKCLKKRLSRGSVTVHVKAKKNHGAVARINPEALRSYRSELEGLGAELGIGSLPPVEALLGLPGVIDTSANEASEAEGVAKPLLVLVDEAAGKLVEMREAEGAALEQDLRKNRKQLESIVAKIERRMPQVVKQHQQNLEKRVNELIGDRAAVESKDIVREVALLADRLDVSEEIARLGSHLVQLDNFLERGGGVGRKLDFLVQEIFREVNTIGSKCSDAKVAHWVVEAKTHVERMREQVQNVE